MKNRSGVVACALLSLLAAGCGTSDDDGDASAGPSVAATTTVADQGDASTTTGSEQGDVTTTTGAAGTTSTAAEEFVEINGVPGVTDDEIRFAALGTSTNDNPTGGCYLECFTEGVTAYFAYRNSEGGVHGRQLVLADPINDELANSQTRALEIISADDAFGVFTAPIVPTAYPEFESAGVPVYTYLTSPDDSRRPNLFGSPFGTNCGTCTRLDQAFIAKAVGATKIAALGYSVESSADCANGVGDTFEAYGEAIGGAELVYLNAALQFGLPNGVAPEVTAMRDAGVEVVFNCLDQNGVKAVAEEMKRQGMGDTVVVQQSSFDESFIAQNAAAFEGAVMITTPRPSGAGSEGTGRELFESWLAETGGTLGPEITVHGWTVARLAVEGLLQAGAPFDRQSVIDATNAITGFTADGLQSPRDIANQHVVGDTADPSTLQPRPYCWVIYQVRNGEATLLAASPDTPWLCWPAPGGEYTEPTPTNFT